MAKDFGFGKWVSNATWFNDKKEEITELKWKIINEKIDLRNKEKNAEDAEAQDLEPEKIIHLEKNQKQL